MLKAYVLVFVIHGNSDGTPRKWEPEQQPFDTYTECMSERRKLLDEVPENVEVECRAVVGDRDE